MKALYQCDFCGKQDVEDVIREHEKECVKDKSKRNCYTCGNKKGLCLTKFECQLKDIPEGKYISNCPDWKDDGIDDSKPYDTFFKSMFGGF